jgi:tellurite resistance protein
VLVLFTAKWVLASEAAQAEARDPVQCCFIGLAGVATILVSVAAIRWSGAPALALFAIGTAFTLVFGVWQTGRLWQGSRDPAMSTPVLYLPTVAGGFVAASGAAAHGFPVVAQLAFGAGFFSWLAIESVLVHRLYTGDPLATALRPTLGIQLAPPAVGAVAAFVVLGEAGRPLVAAMTGYALLQALVLLRLLPWIRRQPFVAGYWGFAFGATALATAMLSLAETGGDDGARVLAAVIFGAANIVIGAVIIGTLRLAWQGRLLPPRTMHVAAAGR